MLKRISIILGLIALGSILTLSVAAGHIILPKDESPSIIPAGAVRCSTMDPSSGESLQQLETGSLRLSILGGGGRGGKEVRVGMPQPPRRNRNAIEQS